MSWLERRIPPPLVALAAALGMWLVTLILPTVSAATGVRMVASADFAIAGVLLSAAGAGSFQLFIDRFQIRPEERALQARFADDYARYRARVRRWL